MLKAFTQKFPAGRGLFISLEGGEGSGKSTQIKLLGAALEKAGYNITLTREPGGCDSAMQLRKLLVEGDPNRWDGLSETLLYYAARHEHLRHLIRPTLAAGGVVVTDRFADSTLVYQGVGRKIAPEVIATITDIVVQDTWPDITLLLDIETEAGLARTAGRFGQQMQPEKNTTLENRFEQLDLSFHHRVREGFLARAAEQPQRFMVVDASGDIPQVHQNVLDALNQYAARG